MANVSEENESYPIGKMTIQHCGILSVRMPFGIKILIAALGLGGAVIAGTALWSNTEPCETKTETATSIATAADTAVTSATATNPCNNSSSRSRRGLRNIFNSRSTTGGGTDVGK